MTFCNANFGRNFYCESLFAYRAGKNNNGVFNYDIVALISRNIVASLAVQMTVSRLIKIFYFS